MNLKLILSSCVLAGFTAVLLGCDPQPSSIETSDNEINASAEDSLLQAKPKEQSYQKSRLIGLSVAPSSQEYIESLRDSFSAGSAVFEIPQLWKDMNSIKNKSILRILVQTIKKHNIPVVVTLNPLDTLENQIPKDLRNTRYDDSAFINRYIQFVNLTLSQMADLNIRAISVGNEVDILLGDDSDRWSQYTHFFQAAKSHIKTQLPNVQLGVKLTYSGMIGKPLLVKPIVNESDVLMMTYYPVDEKSVRPTQDAEKVISSVLSAYPEMSIHLSEIGYPYSAELDSSQVQQANFIKQAFELFDKNPKIELMNFVWLNDIPPDMVNQLKTTLGETPTLDFISTLGLRDHHGNPTVAFTTFREEVKRRGLKRR